MKCKFCEQELPEGAEKCPNCGIPVRSHQKESPPIGAAMTTYRTPEQVKEAEPIADIEPPEVRYERLQPPQSLDCTLCHFIGADFIGQWIFPVFLRLSGNDSPLCKGQRFYEWNTVL